MGVGRPGDGSTIRTAPAPDGRPAAREVPADRLQLGVQDPVRHHQHLGQAAAQGGGNVVSGEWAALSTEQKEGSSVSGECSAALRSSQVVVSAGVGQSRQICPVLESG